ncbi:MAG: hypothetical protein AB8E82_19075 [Aureispira sp.]
MLFILFVFAGTHYFLMELPLVDGSRHEILFVLYSLVVCGAVIKDESRFLQHKVIVQIMLYLGVLTFYSVIYYFKSDFSALELLAYGFMLLPFALAFPKTIQQWRAFK